MVTTDLNPLQVFGGGTGSYYDRAMAMMNKSADNSVNKLKGSADAKIREGNANADITASRGGYGGTPVADTLRRNLGLSVNSQLNSALTDIETARNSKEAEMNLAKEQAIATGNAELFKSMFEGLGSVIKTSIKAGATGGTSLATDVAIPEGESEPDLLNLFTSN